MTNETIYLYRQDCRSGDLVIKFLHLPKYCCFYMGRSRETLSSGLASRIGPNKQNKTEHKF